MRNLFIAALLALAAPAALADVFVLKGQGFTLTFDTDKPCSDKVIENVAPPFRPQARGGEAVLPDGSKRELCFAFIGEMFAFVDDHGEGFEGPKAALEKSEK